MIKITTNFDSRKFMRELERKAVDSVETQVREKLRDLTAKASRSREAPLLRPNSAWSLKAQQN